MVEQRNGLSDRGGVVLIAAMAAGALLFLTASLVWPKEMADMLTGK